MEFYGVDEAQLNEMESFLLLRCGRNASQSLRPLLLFLRTSLTLRQLSATGWTQWSSQASWSDGLERFMPMVSEALYTKYVTPVQDDDPCTGDVAGCKAFFGRTDIRGFLDSAPIWINGGKFSGHYGGRISKIFMVCTLSGLVEYAAGGLEGSFFARFLLRRVSNSFLYFWSA